MNNSKPFLAWNECAGRAETFLRAACTVLLLLTLAVTAAEGTGAPRQPSSSDPNLHYASLPLAFEPNRGQAAPAVKYLARGSGFAVFFTEGEAVMLLERNAASSHEQSSAAEPAIQGAGHKTFQKDVLHLRWVEANASPQVEGLDRGKGRSNYLIGDNPGKWVRSVSTWGRVKYQGIYPGVDLVYYGNHRELEFDIDVAPGADLSAIRLKISGWNHRAGKVRVNSDGELVVQTRAGDVHFRKPRAYQSGDHGGNHFLAARYVIAKDGHVGFRVSGYDRKRPLVIDPVLSYSTYLGGTDYNYATGVAVDASGNTYITGYTSSVDFPVSGGVQGIFAGGSCNTEVNTAPCFDAFVAKLNPQGTGLVYSTYLGGTGDDEGVRIAVDSSGQAYVAGFTDSLDFPTAGPLQGSNGGGACGTAAYPNPCYDAFIAKLTAAGSNLVYSTYLGGTGDDFASSIAADSNGNAYVGGLTSASNFPVTYGTMQASYGGGTFDGFVAKINPTGSSLVYSTYLGGSQEDHVNGVALDSSGDAFMTGQTNSANFPVQAGFQPKYTASSCGSELSNNPCFEGFVSELNPTGSALVSSSYLGGSAASYGSDIALDSSGAAYVTGWTTSSDFPVTQGAYDMAWGGTNEAFVAKVAPGGGAISYATFLGGVYPDQANAIAVDGNGNTWIAGFAYGGKFPVASPLQSVGGGLYDAIVSELDHTGSSLLFSTYLGGAGDDAANDITIDSSGNVYVAGDTFSTNFPITPSAMTTGYTGGSYDAWIARIGTVNAAGLTAVPNPMVFPGQEIHTTSKPSTLKVGDAGSTALGISGISVKGPFAETSQCGQSVSPGTQCTIGVTFTPTAAGTQTGALVINDNATGSPHTVHLSGWGTSGAVSLSASSLDFGFIELGATSTRTVTLTNPAQSPLDISSIQAGGDYSETNNCGASVNAGASCTIMVSFTPSALGTSVGMVTLTDTGLGSPQSITLTGTGGPPFTLSANPNSATVLMGTGQVQFTITASTTMAFTGSIALDCTNISPATCTFSPSSIIPGQSSMLTVGNLSSVTSPALDFTVTGTATPTTTPGTASTTTTTSGNMTVTLALSVAFADFTLAASPTTDTVQAGQTAKYMLTVTPLNGFDLPVSLACSGVPTGATCSFSSSTVQIPASGSAQATLSVHTMARSLTPSLPGGWRGWPFPWFVACAACFFLLLILLSFGVRPPRLGATIRNASIAFTIALALAACGGGGGGGTPTKSNNGTPAGSYTLTVTSTAQSLSHSSKVTLQVN